jgi:hypothetical protein
MQFNGLKKIIKKLLFSFHYVYKMTYIRCINIFYDHIHVDIF